MTRIREWKDLPLWLRILTTSMLFLLIGMPAFILLWALGFNAMDGLMFVFLMALILS